jgi:hypothetical protein
MRVPGISFDAQCGARFRLGVTRCDELEMARPIAGIHDQVIYFGVRDLALRTPFPRGAARHLRAVRFHFLNELLFADPVV